MLTLILVSEKYVSLFLLTDSADLTHGPMADNLSAISRIADLRLRSLSPLSRAGLKNNVDLEIETRKYTMYLTINKHIFSFHTHVHQDIQFFFGKFRATFALSFGTLREKGRAIYRY